MKQKNTGLQADIRDRINYIVENLVRSKRKLAADLGVTPSTISGWSSGRIFPSVIVLTKLAHITETSLDWILLGKGNGPKVTSEAQIPPINKDVFNTVFLEGVKLIETNNLDYRKIPGTFFWGLYILVNKELQNNPKDTVEAILTRNAEIIILLASTQDK